MKLWLLFLLSPLFGAAPTDQLLVLFGSSGYILYRVLDFANDHGYPYVKILSYEFEDFGQSLKGTAATTLQDGLYFELKDERSFVSFLCLTKPPKNDIYYIDVQKYRYLLD